MSKKVLIIAVSLLSIILTACGATPALQARRAAPVTPTPAPATPTPAVNVHKVGDRVVDTTWAVTLVSAKVAQVSDYTKPDQYGSSVSFPDAKPGDVFLIVTMRIQNVMLTENKFTRQVQMADDDGNTDYRYYQPDGLHSAAGIALDPIVQPGMKVIDQQAWVVPLKLHHIYWQVTDTTLSHQDTWKIDF